MNDVTPLRYGILGAANIARQFTKGLAGSTIATVGAVASRDAGKGAAFAAELGIAHSHASYDALLADPEIDAVYIPLPNHMHCEWAIKCAEAGKHVLCEKPLTLTSQEARAMFDAARKHGVHLAEAYPYMSQPQTLRLRELLAEGAIGQLVTMSSAFGFPLCAPDGTPLRDPGNIRLDPAAGGGALLDAGTYSASLAILAAGAAPTRVIAAATWTKSGVDMTVNATIEFASGAAAAVSCSFATAGHRAATVIGDAGIIETSYANHAPPGSASLPLRVRRGAQATTEWETETIPAANGFLLEAESFARLVRLGAGHWNGATEGESVRTVQVLEAMAKSIRGAGWVSVEA